MSNQAFVIRDGAVVADDWTLIAATDDAAGASLPPGKLIVPLKVWLAQRDALLAREAVGVWLDSNEDPDALADVVNRLAVIAINFPKFTDGRGYSLATLLRSRYGFKGELRAIGDVLRDQLLYLSRCGFDAFDLRAGQDPHAALAAFGELSEGYQASVERPQPLFRRRAAVSPDGMEWA